MANPVYGEAKAVLDDGRELTLRYDFNALVEIEEADGRSFPEINEELSSGNPKLRTVRAVVFGGLRRHHAELDLAEVGDLLLTDSDALGGAMQKAMEAMAAANPSKGAKPPRAKAQRRRK